MFHFSAGGGSVNPQSEIHNPKSQSNPQSEIRNPKSSLPGAGRPRALDDAKRREICALIAGGCGLREAARYVRCAVKTIRREAERNPEFQEQLSRSEMYAQLSPLRAMQQAVATHWRAAAWMLERAYPRRFARRDPAAFGPQQARRLLNEVLDIIGSEIADPFQHERIEKRLRATFEYSLRIACDRRRSARDLRRAIDFFEQKDRLSDPLAQFGFPTPNLEPLLNPKPPKVVRDSKVVRDPKVVRDAKVVRGSPDPARTPTAGLPPTSVPPMPSDPNDAPVPITEFAAALRYGLNQVAARLAGGTPPAAPNPPTPVPESAPQMDNNP